MPDGRAPESASDSPGPKGAPPGYPQVTPGGAPFGPGQSPRTERQIEELLDVYTQLFQASHREQSPVAAPRLPPVATAGRPDAPPMPKVPRAPATLAESGLS